MDADRRWRLKSHLDGWLAERQDSFGTIEQLPSGRLRVRYSVGDDRFSAPKTYDSLTDARAWLEEQRKAVRGGFWVDPRQRDARARQAELAAATGNNLFEVYMREGDLRPRTVDSYNSLWRRFVEPSIGRTPVVALTPLDVADWRSSLASTPRHREQANDLLRAVLNMAIEQGRIVANPAVTSRRKTRDRRSNRRDPARTFRLTPAQVDALACEMPAHLKFAVLFAAGTGLRFGEMTALRRSDIEIVRDDSGTVVRARVVVRRAVTWAKDESGHRRPVVGPPKTDAGFRTVALPPRLHHDLEMHLKEYVPSTADGLLFAGPSGGFMNSSTLYGERPGVRKHGNGLKQRPSKGRGWFRARVVIGVPNARWHLLRHTAISDAVDAGASPADLLTRFGHTNLSTSEIYQHAATEADDRLADRL